MEAMSSHATAGLSMARENGHGDASDLASAAAVVAEADRNIHVLWQDSIAAGDSDLSDRLAVASHALRRAAQVLESASVIG